MQFNSLKLLLKFKDLVIHIASKSVKYDFKMALKLRFFFCFKIAQRPGAPPSGPIRIYLVFSICVCL